MEAKDELRNIYQAISYLEERKKEILKDIESSPDKYGCRYKVGDEIVTNEGDVFRIESVELLSCPSVEGRFFYFGIKAVNIKKPSDSRVFNNVLKEKSES